jgi:phytoene/squalene synthetase
MEATYHNTAYKISKVITRNYSTSFSFGISVFAPSYRDAIYAVYGYVRLADEIVDSFHNHNKKNLLDEFRNETFKAIEREISTNPVIDSFQLVVNKYRIDLKYIEDFLNSMEMDLSNSYYDHSSYDKYVYGSAEVVGLMCLKVFCYNHPGLFEELLTPARSLGSAFQKVNFLRDIKNDLSERSRIYLPGVNEKIKITDDNKKELEKDIEIEFAEALKGIKRLPAGVKLGVYSAYLYYMGLFNKIRKSEVAVLLNKRVRISNFAKIILLLKSYFEVKILKTC